MLLGNLWRERANKRHPQSASWDSKLENELCFRSKFHHHHHHTRKSIHQRAEREAKREIEKIFRVEKKKTLVEAEHKHYFSLFSLSIFDSDTHTHFSSVIQASNFQCAMIMMIAGKKIKVQQLQRNCCNFHWKWTWKKISLVGCGWWWCWWCARASTRVFLISFHGIIQANL